MSSVPRDLAVPRDPAVSELGEAMALPGGYYASIKSRRIDSMPVLLSATFEDRILISDRRTPLRA